MNMTPDECLIQIDIVLELMKIVMDGTCDSMLSIYGLERRIEVFKTDLKLYQKCVDSLRLSDTYNSTQLAQLDSKLRAARDFLQQLEVELQTLVWEKQQKE